MTSQSLTILFVEDEEILHQTVGHFLNKELGHRVLPAYSGTEALEIFDKHHADLIISDIKMPGMSGIDLLHEVRERDREMEVILITAFSNFDVAVEAIRGGAVDLVRKPVSLMELSLCIDRTAKVRRLRRERDELRSRMKRSQLLRQGPLADDELIGQSAQLEGVATLIDRVAAGDDTTTLITGETGTGKELVARAIHRRSSRAEGPFIAVSCTALPDTLVETELFGYEKGAFTGADAAHKGLMETADGGTLFLDEVGELGPHAQTKLLRALEQRAVRRVGGQTEIPVDVRILSATNRDLRDESSRDRFRLDLLYRLNVVEIALPPLRERGDDILLLSHHFIEHYSSELGKQITGIDEDAAAMLRDCPFPGNVRELRNLIERACLLCEGPSIGVGDFPLMASAPAATVAGNKLPVLQLAELERLAIVEALAQGETQAGAARILGIGRDALRYRLAKYGIEIP